MFSNVSTYGRVKSFLEMNNCQFIEEFEDDIEGVEWEIYDKELIIKLHTEGIISERGLKSVKGLDVGDRLCFIYCKPIIIKMPIHKQLKTKGKINEK